MASIEITGRTTNSISCRVTALDTSYSKDDRVIYWYVNSSLTDTTTLGANVSSGGDVTFYNLTSGTMYSIYAVVYYDGGSVTLSTVTAQTIAVRPSLFSWKYPKQKDEIFNLTAEEWNTLTSNINAVRRYYGQFDYPFTIVYKGNNFTHDIYNECLYALNPMFFDDLTQYCVSEGDDITADCLNLLVKLVNGL